jgi:hypothetical protein
LRFEALNRRVEGSLLALDVGFGQRWLKRSQLADQRFPRAIIDRPPRAQHRLVRQVRHSFGEKRVVISHFWSGHSTRAQIYSRLN